MKNFWSTLAAVIIGLAVVLSVSFYFYNQAETEKQERLLKAQIENMSNQFIVLLDNTARYHEGCDYTFDSIPSTWDNDPECAGYQRRRDEVLQITDNKNNFIILIIEMQSNPTLKEKYDKFLNDLNVMNDKVLKMYKRYN